VIQRLAILIPFLFAACTYVGTHAVRGSGVSTRVTRSVAPFDAIDASGAFELQVTAGAKTTDVVVLGDDNIVKYFVTQVSGSTLELHLESGSYEPKTPLVVRVSTPALENVQASGAIRISATGLSAADFRAGLSGACQMQVSGTVDRARMTSSGACKVEAYDLVAARVELELNGASKAEVSATELLDVQASGACNVRYRGKPEVKSSTSGVSSVAPE